MKKYEYQTTSGNIAHQSVASGYVDTDDPQEPEGDGWEMCGSAASDVALFWFWRRVIEGQS